MQRFVVKAINTYTKYANNNNLDNDALNYSATWLWALTPHLTGSLSSERTQAQVSFAQVGGTQRNLLTTRNQNFSFDFTVSGAWHLIGGFGETDSMTEQPVLTVPSQHAQRSEGGIRYVSRAGNSVSAVFRYIPTRLVDQSLNPALLIDTDYRDTERELRADWKLTGKSTVIGRLLRKERSNEHFRQRDFSGTGGELRYIWLPTGKLQINAALARDLSSYAAFGNVLENSTYRVDDTLSVSGVWQATAKTTVIARLSRTNSEFRGPVFFPVTLPLREDTLTIASLSADWAISRAVLLSANLEHSQRSSNQQQFQFQNNSFLLGASLKF
jgi:exopolysaccharide biosynthesis operon protein EpsL